MDIKIFNQVANGGATIAEIGDLLPRLRAAGRIEAEVISRLADGLLLQTRFGRIRTSDRLHFNTGDRLELRVSGDADRPTLKAREISSPPIRLDTAGNPRLVEALPANRVVLARIAEIMAETTLIRIADRLLSLPARLDRPRGQLLSLLHKPEQRIIEVEPVERKKLYLALIRHLLPHQPERRPASLVQLYRFAADIAQAAGGRHPAAPAKSTRTGPTTTSQWHSLVPPAAGSAAARQIPLPNTDTLRLYLADAAAATRQTPVPAPISARNPSRRATAQNALQRPATMPEGQATKASPRQVNDATRANPVAPARVSLATRLLADISTLPGNAGSKLSPVTGIQLPGVSRDSTRTVSSRLTSTGGNADAATPVSTGSRTATAAAPPRSPVRSPLWPTSPAVAAAGNIPGQAVPVPIQQLLSALPTLQQLDAPTLRQWFEDLGFIRPAGEKVATTAGGGMLRLLQSINRSESLTRELMQLAEPAGKSRGEANPQSAKPPLQETLLPWVREGIRLVEQALSHNLLQRATLGLQQEAQQPATLSFALPVQHEQQVRALHIELSQKRAAREDSANAWEVRISFEFAGLGPVSCHIALDGFTVAASFYCAKGQTRDYVEQALPELRRQLGAAGFSVGELHGFVAPSGPPAGQPGYRVEDALIDVEA